MIDSFLLKLATPTIGPPLPGICPNVLEDPKPLLPDDPKPPLPDDPKLLPLDDPKLDDPNELPLLPPNALGDEPLEAELSPEFPPLFALPLLDPPLEESVVVEEVSQFDELLPPRQMPDSRPAGSPTTQATRQTHSHWCCNSGSCSRPSPSARNTPAATAPCP
jgi:hypothetical protein